MDQAQRRAAGAYQKIQGLLKATAEVQPGTTGQGSTRSPAPPRPRERVTSISPMGGMPRDAGVQEVARFLALIGRTEAAGVLRLLPPEQVEQILETMAHLEPISRRDALRTLARFGAHERVAPGEALAGPEAAREILVRAFGQEEGERRFYDILPEERPYRFSFLEGAEGRQLSMILRGESVATTAIICANLPKAAAAGLLSALEPEKKTAVVRRLAQMGPVAPEALSAIESALKRRLESLNRDDTDEVDGEARLAEILRHMDLSSSDRILHELAATDGALEQQIRRQLETPDDLLYVGNRDLQKILQRVDDVDIATLLKGKRPELVTHMEANLSERRREMVTMHRESLGPMRRKDVDKVTADFMKLVREMAVSGEIVIRTPGGEEWVE